MRSVEVLLAEEIAGAGVPGWECAWSIQRTAKRPVRPEQIIIAFFYTELEIYIFLKENTGFLHKYLLRRQARGQGERRRNGQFSGTADIQGCGRRILSGGEEIPKPQSAGTVQRCDVTELWTHPLRSCFAKARASLLFGIKEGAVACEPKGDSSLIPSLFFFLSLF